MGKRGQKYFPCEQWKRNLDLFFPPWRELKHPCLLFGEARKREPWEWSLEASLGRGMSSKEIMEYCRIYFKEIESCGHLPRASTTVSTPGVPMCKPAGDFIFSPPGHSSFLIQTRSSIKYQALIHLCLRSGEREAGEGFWEPLALGRCELTFPLLIIKKVSPRAPWRMMYSPLS